MRKITLITFLAVSLLSCQTNDKSVSSTNSDQKMKINNPTEYNQLEEVIVGRWVPGAFEIGKIDTSLKKIAPYVTEEAWEYWAKFENQKLADVFPKDDKRNHDEQENLVKTLEDLGIKVRRPDPNPYPMLVASQCYARDPFITIGDKVILANLMAEQRRYEVANYNRIAQDLTENYEGKIVRMPAMQSGFPKTNAYLEGGDVFVEGKNVYVGITGNATNDNGIEWLRKELGDDYTVHKIPLNANVLHLDCAMMLLNENLGVICKEDFIDYDALPESLKNREWIEVEPKEAQLMATNGVVVNPNTVIVVDAFPHIAKKIREKGTTVIEIPFDKANYYGGGLRCSYHPIRRK